MLLRDCDFTVFRVNYTFDEHVRTPTYGGMDSEYSHTVKDVKRSCLVIAPSSTIARALFESTYVNSRKYIDIETVGQVDLMMRG